METTDADRIIAAHREESHRTRMLLAWLLLGIPLLAGIIWLMVVLVASDNASSSGPDTSCGDNTTSITDLSTCPLSGPELSTLSTCAQFNADMNTVTDPNKTNPGEWFLAQNGVGDAVRFDNDCQSRPQEMLATVLQDEAIADGDYY